MAHIDPPNEELRKLLTDAKIIAVVGASSKPERPSYGIMRRLKAQGYRVIPVNPNETEVLGEKAYPTCRPFPKGSTSSTCFAAPRRPPPSRTARSRSERALFGCSRGSSTKRRPHARKP